MELFGFEKDTLLDLTVNVIPLGIIFFFIVAFAVVPSFGVDPVFSGMQFALMISMFLLLAVLTYYAGKAIEGAEDENEAAELDGADSQEHADAAVDGGDDSEEAALNDETDNDPDELEEN